MAIHPFILHATETIESVLYTFYVRNLNRSQIAVNPNLQTIRNNVGCTPLEKVTDYSLLHDIIHGLESPKYGVMYLPTTETNCSNLMFLPTPSREKMDPQNPMFLSTETLPSNNPATSETYVVPFQSTPSNVQVPGTLSPTIQPSCPVQPARSSK